MPAGIYCSSCRHLRTRSGSTALPARTKHIKWLHVHLRATPAPAPACKNLYQGSCLGVKPCSPPTVVYPFSPPGSQHLQLQFPAQLQRCQRNLRWGGKEGGHRGLLWSPANRSKMGRRPPPNEQAAIGVDHPINCKRAWNGRAQAQQVGSPGSPCKARHSAEPAAPGAQQAEVAPVSPGHGCG